MGNRNYTLEERALILKVKAENDTCYFCGKRLNADSNLRTIEHLTPVNRGGLTVESNLAVACKECNSKKSDMTEAEFYMYLKEENNLTEEINEKINEEEKRMYEIGLAKNNLLNIQDDIEKLEKACKEFRARQKYIEKLYMMSISKIDNFKKEKEILIETYNMNRRVRFIGNLDNGEVQEEFIESLDKEFNFGEIANVSNVINLINNSTIVNSTINNSTIINSTITGSTINNSKIENSTIIAPEDDEFDIDILKHKLGERVVKVRNEGECEDKSCYYSAINFLNKIRNGVVKQEGDRYKVRTNNGIYILDLF